MRIAVVICLMDIATSLARWQHRNGELPVEAVVLLVLGMGVAIWQDIKELWGRPSHERN